MGSTISINIKVHYPGDDNIVQVAYGSVSTDLLPPEWSVQGFINVINEAVGFPTPSRLSKTITDNTFEKHYRILWIDEDNDKVLITSQSYQILKAKNCIHKLHIEKMDNPPSLLNRSQWEPRPTCTRRFNSKNQAVVHNRIRCDNCGARNIVGIRYKCAQCNNFDLCEKCEQLKVHTNHVMFRFPLPLQRYAALNRGFFKTMQQSFRQVAYTEEGHDGQSCDCDECCTTKVDLVGEKYGQDNQNSAAEDETEAQTFQSKPVLRTRTTGSLLAAKSCPIPFDMKGSSRILNSDDARDQTQHVATTATTTEAQTKKTNPSKPNEIPEDNKSDVNDAGDRENKHEFSEANLVYVRAVAEALNGFSENIAKLLNIADNVKDGSQQNGSKPSTCGHEQPSQGAPAPQNIDADAQTDVDNEPIATILQQNQSQPQSVSFSQLNESLSHIQAYERTKQQQNEQQRDEQQQDEQQQDEQQQNEPLQNEQQKQRPDPKPVAQNVVHHPDRKINNAVITMMALGFSNKGGWLTNLLETVHGDIGKALEFLQKPC